jgi:hypothetical protein
VEFKVLVLNEIRDEIHLAELKNAVSQLTGVFVWLMELSAWVLATGRPRFVIEISTERLQHVTCRTPTHARKAMRTSGLSFEWGATLLLRVLDFPASNLGRITHYHY